MKKYKYFFALLAVVLILATFFSCVYAITSYRIYPEGGTWYCEELQISINFDYDGTSKAIIDGEEIACRALYFDASELITVNRVYDDIAYEAVFAGLFVSLKDNELILCDRDTKVEYVFIKQE